MAKRETALLEIAIKQLGTIYGVADALRVHVATARRWADRGSLPGPVQVALLAIIKHPGEYAHHYRAPRDPGRPAAGDAERKDRTA